VPYSPEYLPSSGDANLLPSIAAAAGGKVLSTPADAFAGHAPPVRARLPLWPALLALAAALLPLDIASRRLLFSAGDIRELWQRITSRFARRERQVASAAMSGLTQLQAERRRSRQRLVERVVLAPPDATPKPSEIAGGEPVTPTETKTGAKPPVGPGDYAERLLAAKRRTRR
jgi:hypothetical protein